MPWFPDFTSAVELARLQTRAAGQADPVALYFAALNRGDTHALETVWPGEVVIYDPRAGEIRGHHQLRRFVHHNQTWLAERQVRTETVATTRVDGRAVVELLVHLSDDSGEVDWPIAVVAESRDDTSVVFRTYCSQWPVDGQRHPRAPILAAGTAAPGGVISRYCAAVEAGDTDAVVGTFTATGYFREPIGRHYLHRGASELRVFFAKCFSSGGGIELQNCEVTDDGQRCAVEYNCVRWGSHDLAPQAGIAVYERGADGLLAAVRVYDDIEAPTDQSLV
jgi:ketosteroid isomerase-like protein